MRRDRLQSDKIGNQSGIHTWIPDFAEERAEFRKKDQPVDPTPWWDEGKREAMR